MSDSERDKPTVLVTDAGRGSAISIIRSLGRKGWRVIAADFDPRSLGFRSRYTSRGLVYPAPEASPEECISTLLKAVHDCRVDLLIPVTDQIILPLMEARARFENVCKLALPDAAALEVVTNKMKTLQLAEQVAVPVPRTRLVHTAQEADEAAQFLGWPVVLKPQASLLYRQQGGSQLLTVSYAERRDRLAELMQRFEGRCPVLLQEYYRGAGYGVELLMFQGQPLAAFQHQRLREIPINGGASAFRQSVALDPVLYGQAVRLLARLNWTGLAMVEFKVGPEGPKLMEINGRVWGSLPLAVLSGMDFPGRLADLYIKGPHLGLQEPDTAYQVGLRSRNLELEIIWIAKVLLGQRRYSFLPMPSRRQAVSALLGLLNPATKFDIMSLKDPGPRRTELLRIIRTFAGKLREMVEPAWVGRWLARLARPRTAADVPSPSCGLTGLRG